MPEEPIVHRTFERAPAELVERLRRLGAATLTHYVPYENVMAPRIRPVIPGSSLAGPAFTARNPPRQNLTLHKALELIQPGDVLVVDSQGDLETAVWGGLMTVSAKARGAAGMVVDGAVRDVPEIVKLGWPVWAAGANPRGPGKDTFGAINVPISCGGVRVEPGDIVVCDDDGVAVVPRTQAEEVARGARERFEREVLLAKRLEAGELNYTIGGYDKIVARLGVRELD